MRFFPIVFMIMVIAMVFFTKPAAAGNTPPPAKECSEQELKDIYKTVGGLIGPGTAVGIGGAVAIGAIFSFPVASVVTGVAVGVGLNAGYGEWIVSQICTNSLSVQGKEKVVAWIEKRQERDTVLAYFK